MAKFVIRFGKSAIKFLKKVKPKKGVPKITKGGADATSISVSQKSMGVGSKIKSNNVC